jgi:hypothetical protein
MCHNSPIQHLYMEFKEKIIEIHTVSTIYVLHIVITEDKKMCENQ